MEPDVKIIESLSGVFDLPAARQESFMKNLSEAINYLIQHDFNRLVQILYRMDISESRLKEMLGMHAGHDAGLIIAELVVEREREKILSRRQNKRKDDIPEDEKW